MVVLYFEIAKALFTRRQRRKKVNIRMASSELTIAYGFSVQRTPIIFSAILLSRKHLETTPGCSLGIEDRRILRLLQRILRLNFARFLR